eukprot:641659_1
MTHMVDKNAKGEREYKFEGCEGMYCTVSLLSTYVCTHVSILHKENEGRVNQPNQPTINIAVIGATGAGKSQLCNLLCGIPQQFEVNDDPDSCTKEIQSHTFRYQIEGNDLRFQVIDCPGFFDTRNVLSTTKSFFNAVPHQLAVIHQNIQRCMELKNKQISVFLFLVPWGQRLTEDNQFRKSIAFMRDYFIQKASKHVIYVFSKSKGKTEEDIMCILRENKRNNKKASALILDYLMKINNNCVTTECERAGVNFNQMRYKVLCKIYKSHITNGVCEGAVMWNAIQEQQKIINHQKSKYYTVMAVTSCVGLGYLGYYGANSTADVVLQWAVDLSVSMEEAEPLFTIFDTWYPCVL